MIVLVPNIKKLPQQVRCFRPRLLVTSPLSRAHLRRAVAEAIVGSVAFVLWCECCSVSFQLFALRHLAIEPVRNTKKLPGNLVLRQLGSETQNRPSHGFF